MLIVLLREDVVEAVLSRQSRFRLCKALEQWKTRGHDKGMYIETREIVEQRTDSRQMALPFAPPLPLIKQTGSLLPYLREWAKA